MEFVGLSFFFHIERYPLVFCVTVVTRREIREHGYDIDASLYLHMTVC